MPRKKQDIFIERLCWRCDKVHMWKRGSKAGLKSTIEQKAYSNTLWKWGSIGCEGGEGEAMALFFMPGDLLTPSAIGKRQGFKDKIAR